MSSAYPLERNRKSVPVIFGRVPLDGVKGWFASHWALKIGDTWHEVGPGPDSDNGHIKTRPVLSEGFGSNIVGQYEIKTNEGYNATSGARPSMTYDFSVTRELWVFVLMAVLLAVVGWALGYSPWWTMESLLSVLAVFLLDVLWRRAVEWCLGLRVLVNVAAAVVAWALGDSPWHVMGLLLYAVLPVVLMLYRQVERCLGLRVMRMVLLLGFISGCFLLYLGDQPVKRGVTAVMVFLWVLWVFRGYLWIMEGNPLLRRNEGRDFLSVLGTTTRTEEEIKRFDSAFMLRNPDYKGLTVNCQFYVRELFTFLMEEGDKKRNLPPLESSGSYVADWWIK